jgi:capsular polysaccharide transport system permease protein
MSNLRRHAIFKALQIQGRVISALLRREFIALSGKSGFGFLLIVLEPLVFVVVLGTIVSYTRSLKSIPVAAFVMSGYCIFWGVRFQMMKIIAVIPRNRSLLYHKYVKLIDLMFGSTIIQCATTSLSFLLFIPLILYGVIGFPESPHLVVGSWFLVLWYGMALAFIVGATTGLFKLGQKYAMIINVVHIWITGAFFMVDWFPETYRNILLVFPMVNATEMMRDGLFGSVVQTHYSVSYVVICNIVLTYVGLVMIRKLSLRGAMDDSD